MNDDSHDFTQFMKQRESAARAYVDGDATSLRTVATRSKPATFFGPHGGVRQGPEQVFSKYERDAALFERGSETHFEILHMAASGSLGYWVGFQHAVARMHGSEQPVRMSLRVTEVFHREGNEWKLIHRHADSLASERQNNDSK